MNRTPTRTAPRKRPAGPARPARAMRPATAGSVVGRRPAGYGARRPATAGPLVLEPLGARLVRVARALPDAPVLDRLIRGRMWIGLLAALLLGIVFLQVSLLKLNTGISRDVQAASALELENADLRRQLTQLDGGQQLQELAGAMGMVMPAPGDVGYVTGRADAAQAAASISTPNDPDAIEAVQSATPAVVGLAAAADPTTAAQVPAPAAAEVPAAPAATEPAAVPAAP